MQQPTGSNDPETHLIGSILHGEEDTAHRGASLDSGSQGTPGRTGRDPLPLSTTALSEPHQPHQEPWYEHEPPMQTNAMGEPIPTGYEYRGGQRHPYSFRPQMEISPSFPVSGDRRARFQQQQQAANQQQQQQQYPQDVEAELQRLAAMGGQYGYAQGYNAPALDPTLIVALQSVYRQNVMQPAAAAALLSNPVIAQQMLQYLAAASQAAMSPQSMGYSQQPAPHGQAPYDRPGRGYGGGRGFGRGGGGGGGGGGGRGYDDRDNDEHRRGRGGLHHAARMTPLLNEFRNSGGSQTWTLDRVLGSVAEFSKDQEGSRFIQRALDVAPPQLVQDLFDEVLREPLELMTDVFGNYVVQKMLEIGTPAQVRSVAHAIEDQIVPLSLQTYGCRVVQKAIEVVDPDTRERIILQLEGNVPRCVQDQNGNHVIQKCIEVVPERCDFIVNSFLGRVEFMATHAYGCRVIQCILQHCVKYEDQILAEVEAQCAHLVTDQYGNYVVQHILMHSHSPRVANIAGILADQFYPLSKHKFASNAMEKLYQRLSAPDRVELLHKLLLVAFEDGTSYLMDMMKDQFANYVVQKIIDSASDTEKMSIVEHVRPHVHVLRRYPYGKHIISRLERVALLPQNEPRPFGRGGR